MEEEMRERGVPAFRYNSNTSLVVAQGLTAYHGVLIRWNINDTFTTFVKYVHMKGGRDKEGSLEIFQRRAPQTVQTVEETGTGLLTALLYQFNN